MDHRAAFAVESDWNFRLLRCLKKTNGFAANNGGVGDWGSACTGMWGRLCWREPERLSRIRAIAFWGERRS